MFNLTNIAPTINQTGGANGITRGLYVNPTLTAAADWRSIETVTGNVIFGSTSGNVLVGTTTDAGYKLDVNGTARVSGIVYADSTINQPTSFGNKLLFMNSGNYSKIALADGTNWSLDYHSGITVADVGYHRFYTGSTSGWVERLRIENNGNVGIGITSPTARLHIVSPDQNGIVEIFKNGEPSAPFHFTRYGGNVPINLNASGGTAASPVPLADIAIMSRLTTNTYNGSAFANAARI